MKRTFSGLLRGAAAVAVAGVVAGCESPPPVPVPTQTVSGKVSRNGKPTGTVELALVPTDPSQESARPTARTEPDGTFKITMFKTGDAVPQGEYAVAANTLAGGRYKVSPEKVKIEPETTELPPIVLK